MSVGQTVSETVADAVEIRCLEPGHYESKNRVEFAGPGPESIGYGGFSIAFGVNAAAATRLQPSQDDFLVYSVTGYFTAVASTSQTLKARVVRIRDTKSLATRRVDLYQHKENEPLMVMTMVVDFQKPEFATILEASVTPHKQYTSPQESMLEEDWIKQSLPPNANAEQIARKRRQLVNLYRKFDRRTPSVVLPGGKKVAMDALPQVRSRMPTADYKGEGIMEKSHCYYYKATVAARTHLAHVLSVAYLADAEMPYVPPVLAKINPKDISRAASLDFALRILSNDLNVNDWIMREERTIAARDGRTFGEARIFDDKGQLVAHMSEQCLLRPREVPTATKL